MNRWFALAFTCLATLLARPSWAAQTITVSVKDASMATVTFAGFAAGDFCAFAKATVSGCVTDANTCLESPAKSFVLSSATRVAYDGVALATLPSEETSAVRRFLSEAALWCTSGGAAPVAVPITVAPVWPMTTLLGASSTLTTPNKLDWLGWDDPAFLPILSKLTGKLHCEFEPATNPVTKCSIVRERGPNDGPKLLFVGERELPKLTTVKVKAVEAGKPDVEVVTVPVQECAFSVISHITSLYAGSKEQRLQLDSSTGCLARLGRFATVSLAQGQLEVVAAPQASERALFLQTGAMPSNAPLGWGEWDIRASNVRVGSLRVNVKGPAALARTDSKGKQQLSVEYDREEFNALHSGESQEGQAVVTNPAVDSYVAIINRSSLVIDNDLLRRGDAIATELELDAAKCHTLSVKLGCCWKGSTGGCLPANDNAKFCVDATYHCPVAAAADETPVFQECLPHYFEEKVAQCEDDLDDSRPLFDDTEEAILEAHREAVRPWRVYAKTWHDAWFKEDWLYQGELRTSDPSTVGFAVYSRHGDPLEAELVLRDADGNIVLRTGVVLAAGARAESLPLPIAKALQIHCGTKPNVKDVVLDGAVRGVDDSDLDTGQCRLDYDPERMGDILKLKGPELEQLRASAEPGRRAQLLKELKQQLQLYGSQPIEITITRGKEQPKVESWDIEPATADAFPLPAVKEGGGDYVVSVTLKGTSVGDNVYRPASPSQIAAVVAGTAPTNRQFRATLLPRGFGGWAGANMRVFVTFPIRFTGVRLPAKAAELKSSDDVTAAQLTGVRAGSMVVLEPWNYDTRKNRYPIPIRFMSGMNLFDVGNASFAPALLNGISIALPILAMDGSASASTTETSVSLGAFWELDLETRKPFQDGNHFLLTIGLDVLSLFAH